MAPALQPMRPRAAPAPSLPPTPARRARLSKSFVTLLLALAFAAAVFLPAAAKAPQRPALWAVADGDTTVYLFGSVHALRESDAWRFPALEAALSAAQTVYFEAPTDLFAQASLPFLIAQLGLNPPETNLASQLSAEARPRLRRVAGRFDLEAETLAPMRPWYAFLTLSAAAVAKAGASPAYGVDAVLERDARRAGKEIRTFETLEEQIRIFADMSEGDQAAILEAALIEFEDKPDQLEQLIAAWVNAQTDELERLAFKSMSAAPPIFLESIYTRRNRAWAARLDRLMAEEEGVVLVVVGAAHLVGPEAVQDLLAARGHRLSRR